MIWLLGLLRFSVRIIDFELPTLSEVSHDARVRDALDVFCSFAAEASNIILDERNGDSLGVEDVPSLSLSELKCRILDIVLATAGFRFR
jgi:hypothetical protein